MTYFLHGSAMRVAAKLWLPLAILLSCLPLPAQVTLSLSVDQRGISPRMFGYNGRSTEGPSWENPEFLQLVKDLYPGSVRYPAGTQANYWDWRHGTFIEGSGKTSAYNISIPDFVSGLPDETEIIYVVNMARPTPATGIPPDAPDEVLRSDSVLELKILDMMDALKEFGQNGKLPFAVELGNEFYFDNEHAAIYAAAPDFYLDHAKKIAGSIKNVYPAMRLLLVTTKGGTTNRDYWNKTVFGRLESDSSFSRLIHAVIQHHYINENYGDQTPVSNTAQAKTAIAEGVRYTSERRSDYDLVPARYRLWITEYGATKLNAEGMWASGLRAAAMSITWLDLGDKIECLNFHHITEDPDVINKSVMKKGPAGIALGMLGMAAGGKHTAARIEFANNPLSEGSVKSLHGYKFISDTAEAFYILNISDSIFRKVSLDPVISYKGDRSFLCAHSPLPFLSPVWEDRDIDADTSINGSAIDIKPFSVNMVSVKYAETGTEKKRSSAAVFKVYPTKFRDYFIVESPPENEPYQVRLSDLSGRILYVSGGLRGTSRHEPQLPAGIYIVQARSKKRSVSLKIIRN